MRQSLARLTRRQLIVLAILLVGDVALLFIGFLIVHQAAPASAVTSLPPTTCQEIGAQLLLQHNLAGASRLDADGALRFELSGQDAAGLILPRASDAAWEALAAAATLPDMGCGPYQLVRVDVPEPERQPGSRLLVEVNWLDLRAWSRGELDDGELAARARVTLYVPPEPIRP